MQGFGGEIRKKNAIWKAKSKGKVHPCTGTEALYRLVRPTGVVEVQLYPFMTTELFVGGGVSVTFYPRERPGTHCTGDCVGLRVGLDWCGKSRPTGIPFPDRPTRSQSL